MTAPEARPAPLTPPDCDLTDFKFMPLLVARLRDSDLASEQTPEENWAAVLLWATSWHQVPAASLPDVDATIAKYAGYVAQGKVLARWAKVRGGAMRGWILCSDGRWYHPIVAELANTAWLQKCEQRWETEKSRIKQHNIRHQTKVPYPRFDEWMAAGRPVGQPLPVTGDTPLPVTGDTPPPVTGDTAPLSPVTTPKNRGDNGPKREGEGQGDKHPPSAPPPAPTAPPPAPTPKPTRAPRPAATPTPDDPDERERPTNAAWRAYAAAFRERYGVDPERNQQVNGALATLIRKVTASEVPHVIDFYVRHRNVKLYVEQSHPISLFVRDYHGIRTVWAQTTAGIAHQQAPAPTESPRAQHLAGFAGHAAAGRPPAATRRPAGDITDIHPNDVRPLPSR